MIHNCNGNLQTKSTDTLHVFVSIKNLYKSDIPNLDSIYKYLKTNPFSQLLLKEHHRQLLEEPVSPDEVTAIIKTLKPQRSPGTVGFPLEFYSSFAHILSEPLVEVCNQVLTTGKILPT